MGGGGDGDGGGGGALGGKGRAGGSGGGGAGLGSGDGGGGDGGGEGGADGGAHAPSQSTMYSTYTKLPSYAFSSTALVAVVLNAYVPSRLGGSAADLAHSKKPSLPLVTPSSPGRHLPCTSSPLAVVLSTYSSAASKSVSYTRTVT